MLATPPVGKEFLVSYEHLQQRLDNFLLSRLKTLPKNCLYRLIRQGKIKVNQKRSNPSYKLQTGDVIKIPALELATLTQPVLRITPSFESKINQAIIFENEHLMILNKPRGVAVHGGSGISLGVIETLRVIRGQNKYLELAHRLDRDTSGCLMIAKKPSILRKIHELLRHDHTEKTYLALAKGHWPSDIKTINIPLKKNQLRSGERVVKVDPCGKVCLTEFEVLKYYASSTLLKVRPRTGRTHQIRVHAQHIGHSIAGDEKYGDRSFNQTLKILGFKRLFLHAYQIKLNLSSTEEAAICTKAELPSELESILKQL